MRRGWTKAKPEWFALIVVLGAALAAYALAETIVYPPIPRIYMSNPKTAQAGAIEPDVQEQKHRVANHAILDNEAVEMNRERRRMPLLSSQRLSPDAKCSRCCCMMTERACHHTCMDIPEKRGPTEAENHMCDHLCGAKAKGLDLMDENEAPSAAH